MDDCLACDLNDGTLLLPGGVIFRTKHWRVEHCIGPLGLGSLIVKPERHITAVGELSDDEATELGPLLRDASAIAAGLVGADQTYNCLWSHAGGEPVHIHYVIQPVTSAQMLEFDGYGPGLQVAMFERGDRPSNEDVERIANQARAAFALLR